MTDTKKKRLLRLLLFGAILLLCGLIYALIFHLTGVAIPCPIHALTGWQCPGCGVSRMCLSLLRGDLAAAWGYNPVILCLLPLLAAVILDCAWRYVRTGQRTPHKWAEVATYLMVAILLAFGVWRNL